MITIRDVAKTDGVSIATVSNFVNKSGSVSLETKQRVEAMIRASSGVLNSRRFS